MSRLSDILSPVFALLSSTGAKALKDIEDAGSVAKDDFAKAVAEVKTTELGKLATEADAIVTKAFDTLETDVKAFINALVPPPPQVATPPVVAEGDPTSPVVTS
jgi:hypothetical protein